MQRRNFIRNSSLFAMGVYTFGNIRWINDHFEGTTPTTTDILGPFYRPGAPIRINVVPAGTKGELMHLSGTIFKNDGKTPYKNCVVEIWQCSPEGVYDNTSDDYNFRGAQKTGSDGKYLFTTTVPVPYSIDYDKKIYRPAHVHMRISGNQDQDLVTQIYFSGDPYLAKDFSSKSPTAASRILSVKHNGKENKVVFDVVMNKKFALDASAINKLTGIYNMNDKSMIEFYKNNDLLFAKVNGQIMEALYYQGKNYFTSALEMVKVKFELKEKGEVKAFVDFLDDTNNTWTKSEGSKILKY